MPYSLLALISILIFSLVHLWAEKALKLNVLSQAKLLSIGGGVAIAYVFIDLLPKLNKSSLIVQEAFANLLPFLERHVFIMALLGFLLFFVVDRSHSLLGKKRSLWLSISSYSLFNFLVGYAIVDKNNPEVQPLALFTIAMALHYFTVDYSLNQAHGKQYARVERWILIACLFLGWLLGVSVVIPPAAIALASAFIGGGVIMNVTRHELPVENPNSLGAFLLAAGMYTLILLFLHG